MNKWLAIRLALVAFVLLGSVFVPAALDRSSSTDEWILHWQTLTGLFAFCVVGLLFIVGIQVVNPRSAPKWRYPSWWINPFQMAEPLQPFHLIGYAMLAQGVGALINGAVQGVLNADGVLGVTLGAGTVAGVHTCALVYRRKMTDRA